MSLCSQTLLTTDSTLSCDFFLIDGEPLGKDGPGGGWGQWSRLRRSRQESLVRDKKEVKSNVTEGEPSLAEWFSTSHPDYRNLQCMKINFNPPPLPPPEKFSSLCRLRIRMPTNISQSSPSAGSSRNFSVAAARPLRADSVSFPQHLLHFLSHERNIFQVLLAVLFVCFPLPQAHLLVPDWWQESQSFWQLDRPK